MKELKNNYYIEKVYVVGYFMGGVSLISYIEKVGSDKIYFVFEKFVLIGVLFNGLVIGDDGVIVYDFIDLGLKKFLDCYSEFMKNK